MELRELEDWYERIKDSLQLRRCLVGQFPNNTGESSESKAITFDSFHRWPVLGLAQGY